MSVPFVSAVVLAAGESTRMGRPKALLGFAGTTLIDYQVTQLLGSGEIAEVIVVTGHNAEALVAKLKQHRHLRLVHNADYATGKVSSIKAGVGAVWPDADAMLIIAVDQPRPASVIREIVRRHNRSGALITIPTAGGRRGHPIVLRRDLVCELAAMSEEEQGLRGIVGRHRAEVEEVELGDPRILVDLNAPEDVQSAVSLEW